MRVTTFIAGMAIGALAGMYMADRRSLINLQSKLQLAGNVVTDVVDMAKDKVMDAAFNVMTGSGSQPSQSQTHSTSHATGTASGQQQASSSTTSQASSTSTSTTQGSINLDRIKDLIQRDPELKKQVDAIIHECSVDSKQAAAEQKPEAQKSSSASSSKSAVSNSASQLHHH